MLKEFSRDNSIGWDMSNEADVTNSNSYPPLLFRHVKKKKKKLKKISSKPIFFKNYVSKENT